MNSNLEEAHGSGFTGLHQFRLQMESVTVPIWFLLKWSLEDKAGPFWLIYELWNYLGICLFLLTREHSICYSLLAIWNYWDTGIWAMETCWSNPARVYTNSPVWPVLWFSNVTGISCWHSHCSGFNHYAITVIYVLMIVHIPSWNL